MVKQDQVFAYPFSGYWVDVGTIQAYWETSLAMVQEKPELDLYDQKWVIHTRSEERPRSSSVRPGNRAIAWSATAA